MKIEKFLVPKAAIEPDLKKHLEKQLSLEIEKLGVSSFRFIDIEWVEDGILVYYEDTANKEQVL